MIKENSDIAGNIGVESKMDTRKVEDVRLSNMSESDSTKWRIGTDEPKNVRCITNIFPWLTELYENVRLKLKVNYSEKAVLPLIKTYLKLIRDELQNQNIIRLPNRCYILSRNIVKMLYLFKYLNKQFTDGQEYSSQLCELLSIYTTLELKYSTKFVESKINVANRISLNYDLHFDSNEKCILEIFISIKNFFEQKEVMRKLFEKYLKRKTKYSKVLQKELDDKTYVMYLIAYKHWITLEDDIDEKLKIEDIANAFMRPMLTLRRNTLYAPFIPTFSTKHTTKTILSQNVNILSLMKAVAIDETRNDRGSCTETIDLCTEQSYYNVDENIYPQNIDFPNVKFERPEVVATVDLTTSSENRLNADLAWLDALVEKVRNSNLPKRPANVIDIIEIDDDPTDNERCEVLNDDDDSQHKMDSTKNSNAYRTDNDISGINRTHKDSINTNNNFNDKVDNSIQNIGDFNAPNTVIVSMPCTELYVESEMDLNAQATIIGLCGKSEEPVSGNVSQKDPKNYRLKNDSHTSNIVDTIVHTKEGKINQNLHEILNEAENNNSSYSEIVASSGSLNNASLVLATCNSGTHSTDNEHIAETFELNNATNNPVNSELSLTEVNCENLNLGTNAKTSGEAKIGLEFERTILQIDESMIEKRKRKEIEASYPQGKNISLGNELENINISFCNEKGDIYVNTSLNSIQHVKTYSNRQKKTESMQLTAKKIGALENVYENQDIECSSNTTQKMLLPELIYEVTQSEGDSEKNLKKIECSSQKTSERIHDMLCIEKPNDDIICNEKPNVDTVYNEKPSKDIVCNEKPNDDILYTKNPNGENILASPNKPSDEDDDEFIKNIARKLNESSKKTLTKNKKVQPTGKSRCDTPPFSENLLHDIPTFSSSSDENDDSRDSNGLSILDESDNAEAEILHSAASRNINDDEPVQKILPKMDVRNGNKSQSDNIIFSVTPNNRLTLPMEKVESKLCNLKSNVVFSTANHIRKNIDHNWVDPATEFEENFVNVSQNEITSPPMEKFTKSDKTLFQTFLNKGNELKPPGKSNMKSIDKQHIFLSEAISSENAALEPEKQKERKGVSPTFMDINSSYNLNSSLCNNQKRKIVSFWDTKCYNIQKSNNVSDHKTLPSFQQTNRPGEQVWTADINTYGFKSQPATVSKMHSPSQPNVSSINIKSKPNAACNSDPERYYSIIADDKLFKAQVRLQRINVKILQKYSSINDSCNYVYDSLRPKQNILDTPQKKKERNDSTKKTKSDFDRYLRHKRTDNFKNKKNIKSNTIVSKNHYSKSIRLPKNNQMLSDPKLKKKCNVILSDISHDRRYKKYFRMLANAYIIHSNINDLKNNVDHSCKKHVRFHPSTKIENKRQSSRKIPRLQKESHNLKYADDSYGPKSSKNKTYQQKSCDQTTYLNANVSLKRRRSDNLANHFEMKHSKISEPSFNHVTSSINSCNFPQRIDVWNEQKSTGSNISQVLGYCINSYSKRKYFSVDPESNSSRTSANDISNTKFLITNRDTSLQKGNYDTDDNQVTSTQDPVSGTVTAIDSSDQISTSDVDIQNNYIDTTLEESQLLQKEILKDNGTKALRIYTCNIPSTPSKESCKSRSGSNVAQEVINVKHDEISISSSFSIFSEFSNSLEKKERIINISDLISETKSTDGNVNLVDSAKTYSNVDSVKTVFVPPEIEKIIEADELPD